MGKLCCWLLHGSAISGILEFYPQGLYMERYLTNYQLKFDYFYYGSEISRVEFKFKYGSSGKKIKLIKGKKKKISESLK